MTKKYYQAFVLLLSIIAISCTSGKKALERGEYDAAVLKAVNRLRQNPDQKKAKQTLSEAYPLAHEWHTNSIASNRQSSDVFKWETIVLHYEALNTLHNEIRKCPACMKLVTSIDYSHEYGQAKISAAKVRYEAGVLHLNNGRNGNRAEAKEAYFNFLRCNEYQPGYNDVAERIKESKYYATLKVLVQPIPMHSRNFQLSNAFFENKINEYLHGMTINEFVRFYTPIEAERTGMNEPDQMIIMQFDDFVVGEQHKESRKIDMKKDSVVIGQFDFMEEKTTVDSNGVKTITKTPVKKNVYGSVKATMNEFTIEIVSRGMLDCKIIDVYTNKILSQEKFPGTYIWKTSWGHFNGDERALTKDQIMLSKKNPPNPNDFPKPQDLFIEFTKPIFDQISGKMNAFYRNY